MAVESHAVTGIGSLNFTQGVGNWTEVWVTLDAAGPKVQYLDTGDPRKVLHVGYVALGTPLSPGPPHAEVQWWKYIDFEAHHFWLSPAVNATKLLWSLSPSTHITVYAKF